MKLSELQIGKSAYIQKVNGEPAFVRRLAEMGFISGNTIKVETKAPLADPIEYIVKGSSITLRRSEAEHIIVTADSCCDAGTVKNTGCAGNAGCACGYQHLHIESEKKNGRELIVALVGNPNCGKTTLFNTISGGHEREGNYCGVTVDSKEGHFSFEGRQIRIVDLPGTYSLANFSAEEKYVENYLMANRPDVVINVLDSTNLQRNLFLTTQLYKLQLPIIGALNMSDELAKLDNALDAEQLSKRLGFSCVLTDSRSGRGLQELFQKVVDFGSQTYNYPQIGHAEQENNKQQETNNSEGFNAEINFAFINQVLDGIYRQQTDKERMTVRIDKIVTHKIWGYPIFILVLYLMFQLTYTIGDYPMGWIDNGIGLLSDWLGQVMPDGILHDLFIDGIIGGVGGVIIFLPNILILYLCISLLEDSGYMARAAYIMDRLMRMLGLHGKSFIPMIMGFGCNVPAVMAARTVENRRIRLITMLVTPFMSCSARLPIYLVLSGALFAAHAGLVLFCIYVAGIMVAIVSAKLLNHFLPGQEDSPFLMELPNYRMPLLKSVVRHTWEKGRQYLHKMGTIILGASILIWFLNYYPNHDMYDNVQQQQENSYLGQIGKAIEPIFEPMGANWKMDVGIVAGLGAKEIVVSTLGVLYSGQEVDTDDEEQTSLLSSRLAQEITPLAGLSFMLFALLYFPCFATIVAIGREAGHWKWALFAALYTTGVAWIVATAVYQIGLLF